jgi:hypothetical protein
MDSMVAIYEVLTLCQDFDLRDNLNGGSYSLIQAAYLTKQETGQEYVTQKDHVAAGRLVHGRPLRKFRCGCPRSFC